MEGLEAIWSPAGGTVEALVELADGSLVNRQLPPLELRNGPVSVSLGCVTSDHLALTAGELPPAGSGISSPVSLRISGLRIDHHKQALSALRQFANALFMQVEINDQLPIVLKRHRPYRDDPLILKKVAVQGLSFPALNLDPAPMELYWYGRGASEMPLLQYLAFYQVLEFYFPRFADAEARQRVRRLVKAASFDPDSYEDITRIIRATGSGRGSNRKDERRQLLMTLGATVSPHELRLFLEANQSRQRHFAKRWTGSERITAVTPAMGDQEILDATSRRIYEYRCRIVHAKNLEDEARPLLPYSVEASQLEHDIALLQMLARAAVLVGAAGLT